MDRFNQNVLEKFQNMSLEDEVTETEVVIVMNRPLLCVTINFIKVIYDVTATIIGM